MFGQGSGADLPSEGSGAQGSLTGKSILLPRASPSEAVWLNEAHHRLHGRTAARRARPTDHRSGVDGDAGWCVGHESRTRVSGAMMLSTISGNVEGAAEDAGHHLV